MKHSLSLVAFGHAMSLFLGFGNMSAEATVRRGQLLLAGEAAGLQDALFGFGMRYALISGHFAGRAVNRFLYRRAGAGGYRSLVEHVSGARDPRTWLRRYYNGCWWTPLMYPFARAHAARFQASATAHECREGCDCTYCRCVREAAGQGVVERVTGDPQ